MKRNTETMRRTLALIAALVFACAALAACADPNAGGTGTNAAAPGASVGSAETTGSQTAEPSGTEPADTESPADAEHADTESPSDTESPAAATEADILGTWEYEASGGIAARMIFRDDKKVVNEDVQLGTYTADGGEIKVYFTVFEGMEPFVYTLSGGTLVYEKDGEEYRYERESGGEGIVGSFVREDEKGDTVRFVFEDGGAVSLTTVTPPSRGYEVKDGKLIITASDNKISAEIDIVISGDTLTMTVEGKDLVLRKTAD